MRKAMLTPFKPPFAGKWTYVTTQMRGGAQHRLWRHNKTGNLRWEKL